MGALSILWAQDVGTLSRALLEVPCSWRNTPKTWSPVELCDLRSVTM